jgi:uncharacterized protein YdeI (YjbR/CyaY-like superfamily)
MKDTSNTKQEMPIITFSDATAWRNWLLENHDKANGVWIQFFKKDSGKKTFSHPEALEDALCFGWIDGQAKSYDGESYLQKFTPRRKNSMWSKRNTEYVERLINEGRMQPAGLKEIEAAKADGRWAKAYDSPANMEVPDDFMKELAKDKQALEFFKSLSKTNKFAITWRLQTAKKPETRQRRMEKILDMLSKGEKFH